MGVREATSALALGKPGLASRSVPSEHQPSPASHLTAVECHNILRDRLQHEDNLITQRLSYAIVLNSLLCAVLIYVSIIAPSTHFHHRVASGLEPRIALIGESETSTA